MASEKTDFLRFNAYSMKDLITRKLSEDSKFTDQIYEGSNLAILIDLISYMYQCLIYQLNNAAAESMFSDTQIYENINRLVNLIGYHPQGCKPSQLLLKISNETEEEKSKQFLPGTYIDTGLTCKDGKICFSTDFEIKTLSQNSYTSILLLNGIWKRYDKVFVSNGVDYETFQLSLIGSDREKDTISNRVPNAYIRIIVENKDGTYDSKWKIDTNEIFIQAIDQSVTNDSKFQRIYDGNSKYYTVSLDENKRYQIKFGNGIVGQKLNQGDKVHVFYLATNGQYGDIDSGYIDLTKIKLGNSLSGTFNSDETGLKDCVLGTTDTSNSITTLSSDLDSIFTFFNYSDSKTEEDVEDIIENAPQWFKHGNRLITKDDYEYFFKNYQYGIVDVKCMNNWDYMTTFYRWLYNMGVYPNEFSGRESNPYEFIEKYRLVNNGFQYVDSADANNIYLWVKMTDDTDNLDQIKSSMNDEIQLIKTMTSELYPMKPIDVYFDVSFTPEELYYQELYLEGDCSFDSKYSYIEITMTDNSIYSNISIKSKVVQLIREYFSTERCKIGQNVEYSELLNQIYAINGVERVRTVFNPSEYDGTEDYKTRHCDGLSFASWTNASGFIPYGEDLQINNTSRHLEQFQFPSISPQANSVLEDKIRIIKKSMNTTNPIKF